MPNIQPTETNEQHIKNSTNFAVKHSNNNTTNKISLGHQLTIQKYIINM